MRVFVAGATGAIGRPLVRALAAAGHHVIASTRSEHKRDQLWNTGVEPVLLDALDAAAVGEAIAHAQPDVIVNQLTSLTGIDDLKHFDRTFAATNRLRTEGTDNLLCAARATGVRRFIAQSYTGWPNARTGSAIKTEDDPLDEHPPREQRESLAALRHLERAVLDAPLEGVVLRYATFYGPGASEDMAAVLRKRKLPILGDGGAIWSMIHVEDAASATVAALDHGSGIYNIVDDEPAPVREILPVLAAAVGAKPPMRLPVWLARPMAGEVGVSMLTRLHGSSNAKAKRELGWAPRHSWRHDFAVTAETTGAAAGG